MIVADHPRITKTLTLALDPRTPMREAEAAGAAFARLARAARLGLDDLFGPPRLEAPAPTKQRRPAACSVRMPFGSHKGKPLGWIAENDAGYFSWLATECDLYGPLAEAVEAVRDWYGGGDA